jgi:hypothetical protein
MTPLLVKIVAPELLVGFMTHGSLKFGAVPKIVVRSLALYGRDP